MNRQSSRRQQQQRQQEQSCGICFTRKMTARIDCCAHQFCNTCIKDWVKGDVKTCPLCRRDVSVINSIRTGKVLYRVRREVEEIPVIVLVDDEVDDEEADRIAGQMDERRRLAQRVERQRRQQQQQRLRRQREQEQVQNQRRNRVRRKREQAEQVERRNYAILFVIVCLVFYALFRGN